MREQSLFFGSLLLFVIVLALLVSPSSAKSAREDCFTMYDDKNCQRTRGATTVGCIALTVSFPVHSPFTSSFTSPFVLTSP